SPNSGNNTGSVNFTVFGTTFLNGMTVTLTKANNSAITATNVQAISPTELIGTFNLAGAAIGGWNVNVTHNPNDGGQSGTLANGFTIGSPPTTVVTGAASGVTATGATLNGAANPNGTVSTGYFEYGTTTSYTNTTPVSSLGSGTNSVA